MAPSRAFSPQTLKVLRLLADQPQAWRYGYDLMKETGLRSGTLYPLLMRLSDQGLLESEWGPAVQAGRPPRHAYRLTQAGLAAANAESARSPARRRARAAGLAAGLAAT